MKILRIGGTGAEPSTLGAAFAAQAMHTGHGEAVLEWDDFQALTGSP